MFTLTEEQRKQLLQYMWARPYGEVASHIAMLASLKEKQPESKDDKSKKDLSQVFWQRFYKSKRKR